jgi:hypothetical protein
MRISNEDDRYSSGIFFILSSEKSLNGIRMCGKYFCIAFIFCVYKLSDVQLEDDTI